MRGTELLQRFRQDSGDCEPTYLWEDATVLAWLNDAQQEAAVRGRLLHESERADVCVYPVVQGQRHVPLHSALYEINYLAWKPAGGKAQCLQLVSAEWLDREHSGWRHGECEPRQRWAIQKENSLRLVTAPTAEGELVLEGYRLPLSQLCKDNEPEIHRASHDKLVLWALYRAFSNHDTERFDASKAALAEAEFTRYFGMRPDSDLRRQTREDVVHHNQADFL